VRLKHVRRHSVGHLVRRYVSENDVAHRASRKRRLRWQSQGFLHLFYLLLQPLRLDQQSLQAAPTGQLAVPGEKNASLSPRAPSQFVIPAVILVGGIVTEQTEPLGQFAQHTIGKQPWRGMILHTWQNNRVW
jgi:hypothetical protein